MSLEACTFLLGICLSVGMVLASHQPLENDMPFRTVLKSSDSARDLVEIQDSKGNLVSEVVIFTEEGYQCEKPVNNQKCYVRMTETNDTCFEEVAVKEELPDNLQESCERREVAFMSPINCHSHQAEVNANRVKREDLVTCCLWQRHDTTSCSRRGCCKRFLGICTKKCCKQYISKVNWERKCITGYKSQPYFEDENPKETKEKSK